MSNYVFTDDELNVLNEAISNSAGVNRVNLVCIRDKCLSINSNKASTAKLIRLQKAADFIQGSENEVTCKELAKHLGVSLATVYRLAKDIMASYKNIILNNKRFYRVPYEGVVLETNSDGNLVPCVDPRTLAILDYIKENNTGVAVDDIVSKFSASITFIHYRTKAIYDDKINFHNGYYYYGDLLDEKYKMIGPRLRNYVLSKNKPVHRSELVDKFGVSSTCAYRDNLAGLIVINGWCGKKSWFYKNNKVKDKYLNKVHRVIRFVVESMCMQNLNELALKYDIEKKDIVAAISRNKYAKHALVIREGMIGKVDWFDN